MRFAMHCSMQSQAPRPRAHTPLLRRLGAPVRPSAVAPFSGRSSLAGIRVLVVEDDPASAKPLSVILPAEGCDVQTAMSAEQAAEILRVFRPRVIVLDLVLPFMSGLLFAQRVKSDPATRHIVIVAVTAFKGPEAESVTRSAGCAACVQKPIDMSAFAELIRELLSLEEPARKCAAT
jgi:two-component system cell cycle response regulator DivK